MAEKLTTGEIEELDAAFSLFDKDGSGNVNTVELGKLLRSLGQNPTEIELMELINRFDVDGEGTIDFEEFVIMMATRMQEDDPNEMVREAFRVFDRDKKGYIDCDDLRFVLHLLTDIISKDQIEELIKDVDTDADNRLSFKEFSMILNLKE